MLRISSICRGLLIGLVVFAAGCVGGKPRINDNGELFPAVAEKEALKSLDNINHEYHTYVVIDTFKKVPFYKDMLRKVPKMEPQQRAEFFHNWARKRVPGSSAVYVLIYDGQPESHVEVAVGRDLTKAFPPAERQDMARIIASGLSSSEPATGLTEGIKFLQQRLHTNLGGPVTPKPFDWFGFGVIVLVLAAVWLSLAIVQALGSQHQRPAFAGINLSGYGLGGGYLSLVGAMRTARKRVDAVPPPPPPPFEEKPFPDEPQTVSDDGGARADSEHETAPPQATEDHTAAPSEARGPSEPGANG